MFKDKIIGYFKKTVPNIHQKFDNNHDNELIDLSEYVSKIYTILEKVINNPNQNSISERELNLAYLLMRGTNTLIASFELIRGGYGVEPLIVARNALETCSTAVDLYKNQNKYQEFKVKKYKSANSINESKKMIPIIGQFYGILTNYYTHVSFSSSMPQHITDETGTAKLIIGGMYGKENEFYLYMNLSLVETLLSIFLASTEYIFFKFCMKLEYWQLTENNELKFSSNKIEIIKHKRRINKMVKALSALDNI